MMNYEYLHKNMCTCHTHSYKLRFLKTNDPPAPQIDSCVSLQSARRLINFNRQISSKYTECGLLFQSCVLSLSVTPPTTSLLLITIIPSIIPILRVYTIPSLSVYLYSLSSRFFVFIIMIFFYIYICQKLFSQFINYATSLYYTDLNSFMRSLQAKLQCKKFKHIIYIIV